MKKLLSVLAIGSLVLFLAGCGKEKPVEEHKDLEPDGAVIGSETVDGLKISQLSIVYEDNVSKIVADVENTNDTDYNLRVIAIKLYDEDDNLLTEGTTGYIGSTIKSGEIKKLTTQVTKDLRSATRAEYEILK